MNKDKLATKNKPRQKRKITPKEIAQYKVLEHTEGNGSAAVRKMYPTLLSPHDRAWRIRKIAERETAASFIDTELQTIGVDAIKRVGKMVNSVDERVATKNSHFVLEQIRGKAVQKTENKNLNINIESVLE